MAELNARIVAKASGTASEEPLAADLEVAELAVNTADGKLFTKHTDGSIVTISGGGGDAGTGLTGASSDAVGGFNLSSFPVSIPSNAAVGDLAVISGSVRAGGDPNSVVPIAVPSGWTLASSQGYTSSSSTVADLLSFVLHKELDASDISAGSVSLSLTTSSAGDDWFVQIASFSNATLGAVTIVDTTSTGSLPVGGYDFTGPAAPAGGFTISVATSVYAFNTTSGVRMTPLSGADVAWLNPATDGSGYESGVVRRVSSFLGTGINSFNILALNNIGSPVALTDGYHIVSAPVIPKPPEGAATLSALNDVNTTNPSPAFSVDFEGPYPYVTQAGAPSTEQAKTGTTSFKGTDSYGSLDFGTVLQSTTKRYDCWSFWLYNTNTLNSTYRVALGGTLQALSSGTGYAIYTRDTGFGLYSNSAFSEVGTLPTIAANQWHHFAVQVDFGSSSGLTRAPASVSVWVDGSIAVNNETWPQALAAYSVESEVLEFAWASSSAGTSHNKYYDDLRVCQTDTPITSMTTSTIVEADYDAAVDATQIDLVPLMGLVYNGSKWTPGWPSYYPPASGSLAYSVLEGTSYSSGSLEITGLDQIPFSSADVPSGDTWKFYVNAAFGAGVFASSTLGTTAFNVHPTKGAGVRTDNGVTLRLEGDVSATDNTPEVRFETGSSRLPTPTGNYLGFKLPSSYSVDQTYTLPLVDGSSDYVLVTNGSGVLSWSSPRVALGIAEYADDAAAGTGGVASGSLYYNTGSSSYVLKS